MSLYKLLPFSASPLIGLLRRSNTPPLTRLIPPVSFLYFEAFTFVMESLASLWENLSLFDLEGKKFDLDPAVEFETESILAARFLTRRLVNLEAVACTFRHLWRAEKGFRLKDMGENIVTIYFTEMADLERVISTSPWTYDKSFIVFQRTEDGIPVTSLDFNFVDLWIQIHGLPPRYLNSSIGKKIGSALGKVLPTIDSEDDFGWRDFVQTRVVVDIRQPLCHGRRIGLGGGKEVLVSFKYEKLANFCY